MACRVGITTDPARRKEEWKRRYPSLRKWRILSTHSTKRAAQERERLEARERGCRAHHGGEGPLSARHGTFTTSSSEEMPSYHPPRPGSS